MIVTDLLDADCR